MDGTGGVSTDMRQFVPITLALLAAIPVFAGPDDAAKPEEAVSPAVTGNPAATGKPAVAARPAVSGAARAEQPRSIANLLATRRLTVDFEDLTLEKVVAYLRTATGMNIVLDKARLEKEGLDPEGLTVTIQLRDVTVREFFGLALEPLGLAFKIQGNVLLLTTRKAARGKPVLRLYDVSELVMVVRDFPGPDINIHPSNYEPPDTPEPEMVQAVESTEELADMIRRFCGEDTWDEEGVSIYPFRRHLFIRTYPEVHEEIARFLAAVGGLR